MIQPFDQLQKFGQDQFEAAVKVMGTFSQGAQTIAADSAELAKKTFENGSSAVEQLLGARSPDKIMEIQADFVRKSYDGFVSHSAKLNEFYTTLASEAFRPYGGWVNKSVSA